MYTNINTKYSDTNTKYSETNTKYSYTNTKYSDTNTNIKYSVRSSGVGPTLDPGAGWSVTQGGTGRQPTPNAVCAVCAVCEVCAVCAVCAANI